MPAKRKYQIVDEDGLREAFPNLFKHVPDHAAIASAISARFDLHPFVAPNIEVDAPLQPQPTSDEIEGRMQQADRVVDDKTIDIEEVIAAENTVAAGSTAIEADDPLGDVPGWAKP